MSAPNTHLRVDKLSLQNFRCFTDCELELHPELTVLVADNALGKSALLDALRLALNVFVTTMGRSKQCRGFERTDVHLALEKADSDGKEIEKGLMQMRFPVRFTAEGIVSGESVIKLPVSFLCFSIKCPISKLISSILSRSGGISMGKTLSR